MAQKERYFLGPSLLSDIRDTIRRVDAIAPSTSGAAQPVRLQGLMQGPSSGSGLRIGKTTAVWNKGTLATIDLYENGTPPNETRNNAPYTLEDCVNKFSDVGSGKWVMVGLAGNGRWYLVAAECD